MNRITDKHLDFMLEQINKAAGTPLTYSDKTAKGFNANVGHYHLSKAYGGNQLVQTMNDGGGIQVIGDHGYVSKREIYAVLCGFLAGIKVNEVQS